MNIGYMWNVDIIREGNLSSNYVAHMDLGLFVHPDEKLITISALNIFCIDKDLKANNLMEAWIKDYDNKQFFQCGFKTD